MCSPSKSYVLESDKVYLGIENGNKPKMRPSYVLKLLTVGFNDWGPFSIGFIDEPFDLLGNASFVS